MHTDRLGAVNAIRTAKRRGQQGLVQESSGRRPWRLSAKLLIASSIATVIGFSAICTSVMLDMRRGEEELARQTLENLASGIDADISRNIELYDLSLRAVASNLVMPEIKGVSKEIRHLILFDHAATAKHFGVIQVFDAQGKLTHRCRESRSGAGESRRRGIFPGPSRPIPIWACTSAARCCAAAPIRSCSAGASPAPMAAFSASSSGSIRFSYFHDLFGRLTLDPGDTITVLRRDRTIIMRTPFDLDVIGKNLAERPDWRAENLKQGATYAGVGPVDPTPRLLCPKRQHDLFFVVVGKPLASILNLWHTGGDCGSARS